MLLLLTWQFFCAMKWPSVTHCCHRFSWFHKEPFCRASVIMGMKIIVCSRWHYWGCRLHFPFPETQTRMTYIRFRIVSFSLIKVKSLYLTSEVPSVKRLVSMEDDSAPFSPFPPSVLRFTDQRKVKADVEVTKYRTGDLLPRKPLTNQLSHASSYY